MVSTFTSRDSWSEEKGRGKEREEKDTEDMMSEDRSACGRAFGDVLGGLKLKKRMLDWGGCVYEWVGPGDEGEEEKERNTCLAEEELTSLLEKGLSALRKEIQEDQQKELTSLLEMAKENGVGWRKEKVLTKAEETETANVNAAWAKMKALEAKLEADELKAMSLEDAKSEIWNMVAERNKVEAKLEACERKAMAQEDTIEKCERTMARIQKAKAGSSEKVHCSPLGQRARKA